MKDEIGRLREWREGQFQEDLVTGPVEGVEEGRGDGGDDSKAYELGRQCLYIKQETQGEEDVRRKGEMMRSTLDALSLK